MTAQHPAQAVQLALEPLQRVLSCVTNALFIQTGYDPSLGCYGSLLSENPALLQSDLRLLLSAKLQHRVNEVVGGRNRRTAALAAYSYRLLTSEQRELFAYHWHPEGTSLVAFPHLHVAQAGGEYARLLSKAHFPTGPIALPDVLRLVITDFGVRPQREDWASVLDAASRVSP